MKRSLASIFLVANLIVVGSAILADDILSPPGAAPSSPAPELSFMSVSGTHLSNAETKDFRFVGINLDPWRFIVQRGEIYSRENFDEWLKAGKAACGATVVRVHMNGGAFEPTPGEYSEEAFGQLDSLIAAARDNGVYVIVALRDYIWSPWPRDAYDPYWYLGGGTRAKPNKNAILTNSKAKGYFKDYIKFVLSRTNTRNGVVYKDDPTIMAWELINEPNIIPNSMRWWLKDMGKAVRAIDSRHLVAIGIGGVEASWWRSGSPNWEELKVKEVDLVDLHYYAAAKLYNPIDGDNVVALNERIKAGLSLGKPIVFGEFGFVNTTSDIVLRNLYATVLGRVFELGGSGGLPYSWGPPGPNGWGGSGSFCLYSDRASVCSTLSDISGASTRK
jgi:endo-1,4-beta-mannosidase